MFIKGLPSQYRRGIDYGFPLAELEHIRQDHPAIEVLYNIDSNRMEVWARGDNSSVHCLFQINKGHTYKALAKINEMRYASANRAKNGSRDMARNLEKSLDKQRTRQERRLYESMDPDRMAYDAANHLNMRGEKGAPGIQVSQAGAA